MRPFAYERADSPEAATRLAAVPADAHVRAPVQFLAGGTTLLDLMKLDVMRPDRLVDINPLADTALGRIEAGERGLRLGALVRMADAAGRPVVQRDYPVVAQALQQAASEQLRNMASLGGNVLQRTRCLYFRDTSWPQCNKREPGSGCAALGGVNRQHAVLGTNDRCIATYPGDLAQALVALAAAAVALDLAPDGMVREARIGLGGVATVPWRAREAEATLRGKRLDEAAAQEAAEAAFAG